MVEVVRKPPLAVLAQPVFSIEGGADSFDGVADLFLLLAQGKIHSISKAILVLPEQAPQALVL
jgi:hypothetical protein